MTYNTFVFSGPPLSGKDTQANLLSQKTGIEKFSTGEHFRELMTEDTPFGRKVKETHNAGHLMPPWLADYVIQEKMLYLEQHKGIIFSGGVRTPEETRGFYELMEWLQRPFKVFYLDVPFEELEKRIEIRKGVEDRKDDEQLETRLKDFESLTKPSIEFLKTKGVVIDIDGTQSVEEIHNRIWSEVKDCI